ncbi:hypothetical protein CDCA_CDCA12G3493 [Cyanidium caldarium]|uniref:Uncharacterized protein n=1 Tax=Cyanidium caldarium TaxID=2771 RepID=A0AAV9J0C4_CYACA|nr:hypothetical protein CDCA_CDCA12G3493 [Cyanidium caldarium]
MESPLQGRLRGQCLFLHALRPIHYGVRAHVAGRGALVRGRPSSVTPAALSPRRTASLLPALRMQAADPSTDTEQTHEPFVVRPDLKLSAGVLALTALLATQAGGVGKVAAVPLGMLGVFLAVNTTSLIRFRFGPDAIEVWKRGPPGADDPPLPPSELPPPELRNWHKVRGWHYRNIVYWKLWWPRVPILFYFRETESYDGRGSIHFLPMIVQADVWKRAFEERTVRIRDNFRY